MVTKHTILSEKELNLLESLIANHGNIIEFKNFYDQTKSFLSRQEAINLVMKLKKNGWLIPIKKGIYAIADISSHGFTNISPLIIAKTLVDESYVSFEDALSHYDLFEQMVKSIISITSQKPRFYRFQDLNYKFLKIKSQLYFGFKGINIEGHKAQVAELEKIFLDYLYFRNDSYSIDLIWEKLNKGKEQINFKKMVDYSLKFPLTTKRKLGFLLDKLGENTQELLKVIHKKGYSHLTKNSKKFNSKWRIYYEYRFDYSLST
jgi:predicted transcriptional regulator of viral defense system